jgi:hypothetical protein
VPVTSGTQSIICPAISLRSVDLTRKTAISSSFRISTVRLLLEKVLINQRFPKPNDRIALLNFMAFVPFSTALPSLNCRISVDRPGDILPLCVSTALQKSTSITNLDGLAPARSQQGNQLRPEPESHDG